MKGKYWIALWVFLLLLQVLTYWIARERIPVRAAAYPPPDPDLLDLARVTQQQWPQLDETIRPAFLDSESLSRDEHLLQREALLLRLRDMQSGLSQSGAEVNLAGELENWIQGGLDQGTQYSVSQYITNLVDWLERLQENPGACAVHRLSLHPDTRGTLPSVAFEFSGNPMEVGRQLLSLRSDRIPWRIREMDILREDSRGWWIRGSLSFDNDPFR